VKRLKLHGASRRLSIRQETIARLATVRGGDDMPPSTPTRIIIAGNCTVPGPYTDRYTNCNCGTGTCDGCTLITF
jgi:hypothetical protein